MHVKSRSEGIEFNLSGIVLAGATTLGQVRSWKLQETEHLQLIESEMLEGFHHPNHVHPANESVGFVVSGRLEMIIDGERYELKAGDSWHHPQNAFHQTKALEDSHMVEIHFPRRPDYEGNGPQGD